jgi:uncharacterized membrane protein
MYSRFHEQLHSFAKGLVFSSLRQVVETTASRYAVATKKSAFALASSW